MREQGDFMNTRASHSVTLSLLLGVGLGCSTSTPIGAVDESTAGMNGGTTGKAGSSGAVPPGTYMPSAGQAPNDQPLTNPTGVSGDWVGYLENYDLYFTGSDALRLHFAVDAAGHSTLTVTRGTGTPPAPPTDPYQAWPAAIVGEGGSPGPGISYPGAPVDGFTYAAHGAAWKGSRLTFQLADAEPWTPWCNLQTSYLVDGNYSCNEANGFSCNPVTNCHFTDKPAARFDLNHATMCLKGICSCNATGCGANLDGGTSFDITFLGDHAVGSMANYNLILMPAQP
jgi:hypothetical protein